MSARSAARTRLARSETKSRQKRNAQGSSTSSRPAMTATATASPESREPIPTAPLKSNSTPATTSPTPTSSRVSPAAPRAPVLLRSPARPPSSNCIQASTAPAMTTSTGQSRSQRIETPRNWATPRPATTSSAIPMRTWRREAWRAAPSGSIVSGAPVSVSTSAREKRRVPVPRAASRCASRALGTKIHSQA